MLDTETGEVVERRLEHENGEARRFYAGLQEPALVGIESTGYTRWFAEMLAELGHELAVGDAAKIRAQETRKQKHDRRDAELILEFAGEGRFPPHLAAQRRRTRCARAGSSIVINWCSCARGR